MDATNFGDLDAARRRRRRRRASKHCHVKTVRVKGRGQRFMLICDNKPPRFISEGRAKAYRKR